MGSLQGRASPCCVYHPTLNLHVAVHGDGVTALGTDDDSLQELTSKLGLSDEALERLHI